MTHEYIPSIEDRDSANNDISDIDSDFDDTPYCTQSLKTTLLHHQHRDPVRFRRWHPGTVAAKRRERRLHRQNEGIKQRIADKFIIPTVQSDTQLYFQLAEELLLHNRASANDESEFEFIAKDNVSRPILDGDDGLHDLLLIHKAVRQPLQFTEDDDEDDCRESRDYVELRPQQPTTHEYPISGHDAAAHDVNCTDDVVTVDCNHIEDDRVRTKF
ncbi:MAG: hypothetical protein GY826_12900 [Fuerstiella sp.]|nr:hypothetical protein [Fuerstiella sp.]